ncbi:hypothetical protein [Alteromonas lipotrueae]|nr:hypothetical protein [Alteromonas lipotrueae]
MNKESRTRLEFITHCVANAQPQMDEIASRYSEKKLSKCVNMTMPNNMEIQLAMSIDNIPLRIAI